MLRVLFGSRRCREQGSLAGHHEFALTSREPIIGDDGADRIGWSDTL